MHAYSGVPLSLKKEQSNATCSNTDRPRVCHTECGKSDSERQTSYTVLTCEILKTDTNELIHKRETESQTWETSLCVPKRIQGSGEEEEIN